VNCSGVDFDLEVCCTGFVPDSGTDLYPPLNYNWGNSDSAGLAASEAGSDKPAESYSNSGLYGFEVKWCCFQWRFFRE